MLVRENLSYDYYINWEPKSNIYNKTDKDITNDLLIKMYNEYIVKLSEFIKELNKIKKNIKKLEFKPNYRQIGGYKRCVVNYPDKGWNEKYEQYIQAYKELMVDFLYYSPDLDYDDLSIKEIDILKEMASFLVTQAEININDLMWLIEHRKKIGKVIMYYERWKIFNNL